MKNPLSIKFGYLGRDAKKKIWKSFLDRVKIESNISENEIDNLSDKTINGRQAGLVELLGLERTAVVLNLTPKMQHDFFGYILLTVLSKVDMAAHLLAGHLY
jgi:hypothetical protein